MKRLPLNTEILALYCFPESNQLKNGNVLGGFYHPTSLYEIWQKQNFSFPQNWKETVDLPLGNQLP